MNMVCPVKVWPVLLVALLSACAAPPAQRVGADRDAHGCIGSAGYAWCAREAACVRPWELAAAKGFAVSEEAFAGYCRALEK